MGVGLYYKFKSDEIDAPLEQVAEKILKETLDVEVDFSSDKKNKR